MTYQNTIPLADVLRDHIREDQIARLTVSSNSMAPLLKSGDIIGLQQADPSDIQCGQIITFCDPQDPQTLLTHRVAASWQDEQGEQFILTRGDHRLLFDRAFRFEQVVGHVIWRIRDGRRLRIDQGMGAWLSRQLGRIAERERRQITGIDLARIYNNHKALTTANNQTRVIRKGKQAGIVRAVSRRSGQLLAAVVLLFSKQEAIGVEAPE